VDSAKGHMVMHLSKAWVNTQKMIKNTDPSFYLHRLVGGSTSSVVVSGAGSCCASSLGGEGGGGNGSSEEMKGRGTCPGKVLRTRDLFRLRD
jgi:hypothetical protein